MTLASVSYGKYATRVPDGVAYGFYEWFSSQLNTLVHIINKSTQGTISHYWSFLRRASTFTVGKEYFTSLVPRRRSLVARGALCVMGLIIRGSLGVVGLLRTRRGTPGRSCSVSWQKYSVSCQKPFSRLYQRHMSTNHHWKVRGSYYCQHADFRCHSDRFCCPIVQNLLCGLLGRMWAPYLSASSGATTTVTPPESTAGMAKQRVLPPPVGITITPSLSFNIVSIISLCPSRKNWYPKTFFRVSKT